MNEEQKKEIQDKILKDYDDESNEIWDKTEHPHIVQKKKEEEEKVKISNFFDNSIQIKNIRLNDEDFDRYNIKGWNID